MLNFYKSYVLTIPDSSEPLFIIFAKLVWATGRKDLTLSSESQEWRGFSVTTKSKLIS